VCDTMQRGRTDAMAVCARMTALVIFGISLLVITDVMSVAACQSVGGKGTAGDDLQLRTGDQLRLKDYAMLMSHWSITGYANPMYWTFDMYAKTQGEDFRMQLNHGARAFDVRAYCRRDRVSFGPYPALPYAIDVEGGIGTVTATLRNFSSQDKTNRDLYVILFSSYSGYAGKDTTCQHRIDNELKELGISRGLIYCSKRDSIVDRTVADIKANYTDGGESGQIIALDRSCADQNHDPTHECFGLRGKGCMDPDDTFYEKRFDEYWNRTITKAAAARTRSEYGKLQIMQAHWQHNVWISLLPLGKYGGRWNATKESHINEKVAKKLLDAAKSVPSGQPMAEMGYGVMYSHDFIAANWTGIETLLDDLWEANHKINGFVHIPKRPYIVT